MYCLWRMPKLVCTLHLRANSLSHTVTIYLSPPHSHTHTHTQGPAHTSRKAKTWAVVVLISSLSLSGKLVGYSRHDKGHLHHKAVHIPSNSIESALQHRIRLSKQGREGFYVSIRIPQRLEEPPAPPHPRLSRLPQLAARRTDFNLQMHTIWYS